MRSLGLFGVAGFVILLRLSTSHCLESGAWAVSDDYIRSINDEQTHWKAGRNFAEWVPRTVLYFMSGGTDTLSRSVLSFLLNLPKLPLFIVQDLKAQIIDPLPETFDGRIHWPAECRKVISRVSDTGVCAASWALSVAQAIHDRYCVLYKRDDRTFSAKYLLDCCPNCGHWGCRGGDQGQAYEYLMKHGLPTGSNLKDGVGCQPWSLGAVGCLFAKSSPPGGVCMKSHPSTCESETCTNANYGGRVPEDELFKIQTFFRQSPELKFFFQSDDRIKRELYTHGSVTAQVTVYDDFINYKRGVYYPTSMAALLGEMTMRIIGWGVENGYPYWLAVNVWGKQWGDGGFVKLRARDHKMNIEQRIYVGRLEPVNWIGPKRRF